MKDLALRRTDRVRPPAARIAVRDHDGTLVGYKLLDITAAKAVVQGPPLDEGVPVEVLLAPERLAAGIDMVAVGAVVVRQVPLYGKALIELRFDGEHPDLGRIVAQVAPVTSHRRV